MYLVHLETLHSGPTNGRPAGMSCAWQGPAGEAERMSDGVMPVGFLCGASICDVFATCTVGIPSHGGMCHSNTEKYLAGHISNSSAVNVEK
jgi:hypothetical protein